MKKLMISILSVVCLISSKCTLKDLQYIPADFELEITLLQSPQDSVEVRWSQLTDHRMPIDIAVNLKNPALHISEGIFLSLKTEDDVVLYLDSEPFKNGSKICDPTEKQAVHNGSLFIPTHGPKKLVFEASDGGAAHKTITKIVHVKSQEDIDREKAFLGKLDETDAQGKTALHRAVEDIDTVRVQRLLELGADVNIRDGEGTTALYKAVENSNPAIVKQLLQTVDKNGNVIPPNIEFDVVDSAGNNIIHKAFWLKKGEKKEEIVRLLFDYFTFYGSKVLDTLKYLFQTPNNPPLSETPVLPMEIAFMDNPDYKVCSLLGDLVRDIYQKLMGIEGEIYRKLMGTEVEYRTPVGIKEELERKCMEKEGEIYRTLIGIEKNLRILNRLPDQSDREIVHKRLDAIVKKKLGPVFRIWTYVGNTRRRWVVTKKYTKEENDEFNQNLAFIRKFIENPSKAEFDKYPAEQEVKVEERKKKTSNRE